MMSDLGPALERVRDRFVPPEGAFDRLVARRARKRRNQRAAAAGVALILSGATAAGLWNVARVAPEPPASSSGGSPGRAADPHISLSPSPSPSLPPPARFVPETYREADRVVLPVTFPDGSTAELVYPPELEIAELGLLVYGSGSIPGFARDFWVFHGPLEQVLSGFGEATLLAEYPDGLGGIVGFWRLPADDQVDYLAFQFDSWTVLVYDYGLGGAGPRMSDADRALWAANFRGRETADGFLVLEGIPPLRLARGGEHAGPSLGFGEVDERMLDLFPGKCTAYREGEDGVDDIDMVNGRAVSRGGGGNGNDANFCLPEASMVVHVYEPPGDTFVDQVLHGLEIRNVKLVT